jgi:hypothetical protein
MTADVSVKVSCRRLANGECGDRQDRFGSQAGVSTVSNGRTKSLAAGFQDRSIDALHCFCDRLAFTAGLSTGIVPYNRDGPVSRRMRSGRRQVVDADI